MSVVDLAPNVGDCTAAEADALAAKVMAAAADVARQEAIFLEFLGEFDARNAVRFWSGFQTTAQWLAWACSMAPGTAREHVRAARALRRMPLTRASYTEGELTFSKVRELTRLVDRLPDPATEPELAARDEARLVEQAKLHTARQLARTVSGYRSADDAGRRRRSRQRVSWSIGEDGMYRFTLVLPPEQGAAVQAAIQAAADANRQPDPKPGDECPDDREPGQHAEDARVEAQERTKVEALYEIATHYLSALPEERSGEDRTMVVLEIDADALTGELSESGQPAEPDERQQANVPGPVEGQGIVPPADPVRAGSRKSVGPFGRTTGDVPGTTGDVPATAGDVPAGTSGPNCRVRGGPGIDASAARRALCDAAVLGMIINELGEPLAVGRTQRLVTRAQRRALMVRDGGQCQYPGCNRDRRLQAHHRISWLDRGPTDTDNLILLCRWHHTRVHEDQIMIIRCDHSGCSIAWRFTRPDGTAIAPLLSGLGTPSPWQPVMDSHGRPLTGPAAESARRLNDELVAAHQAEQAALRARQEELRRRYSHVDHPDHPDARRVFPVGGGEGYNRANCVDVLFNITKAATTQAA